ncbi:nucleoside diphosphate-linked moiety X motif 8-like [Gigantopelta aegis]|uniref:nucleoside diphosphate-linked moiety X motif 8-like n=1 Tax=Gigantopelta aegis TaxID=1735272 RepID=UPI001B887AFB|nr:nucleoside diphosphate-linked moiety X motif 8-like [Gigantopelta aegis]XP_041378235.1 nucleoside diphosphate-linked moiety X motif 8-like [Gigantopelta aegis]
MVYSLMPILSELRRNVLKVKSVRSPAALGMKEKPAEAAVLIPLCYVERKPSILFTVRTSSLRKHRGEVSFPGGHIDSTDKNIVHSALREMEEEIGISMDKVIVLGSMPALPSRLNMFVTPVLGFCGDIDINKLKLSSDEVEEVFSRSIESLCDPANFGTTQFRTGTGYTLPVYIGGNHRIWGFTAIALHHTLTLLAPSLYRAKVRHRR